MKKVKRILVVDQGNTLVKMTLFEDGAPAGSWARDEASQDDLLTLAATLDCRGAIYSGVGKINTRFVETLRMTVGEGFMLFTPRVPVPISNLYVTPETLGVDRLAAAVGAWSLDPQHDLLVVDAGTAITADSLSCRHGFLGGAISPGVRMRLESMARLTARLPLVEPQTAPIVGDTTRESLLSGALNGAVFEIDARARLLGLPPAQVFLTGGDAPILREAMERTGIMEGIRLEPDLLVRGLYEIYRFNDGVVES